MVLFEQFNVFSLFTFQLTFPLPTGLKFETNLETAFSSYTLMATSNLFSASNSTDISTTFSVYISTIFYA